MFWGNTKRLNMKYFILSALLIVVGCDNENAKNKKKSVINSRPTLESETSGDNQSTSTNTNTGTSTNTDIRDTTTDTAPSTPINVNPKNHNEVFRMAKSILEKNDYGLAQSNLSDMKDFCPQYKNLSQDEREDFWAHLVAAMARYESGYNSKTTLGENNGNISRGLLQISFGSLSTTYKKNGCSVIKSEADLHVAQKNIECGFAIITTLTKRDNTLAENRLGAARYWSVLRTPYKVFVRSLNRTVNVGKKLNIISDLKGKYPVCF
jgi:hypothetical protein